MPGVIPINSNCYSTRQTSAVNNPTNSCVFQFTVYKRTSFLPDSLTSSEFQQVLCGSHTAIVDTTPHTLRLQRLGAVIPLTPSVSRSSRQLRNETSGIITSYYIACQNYGNNTASADHVYFETFISRIHKLLRKS